MEPNEVLMQLLMAPFPQMLLTSIATLVISYLLLRLTRISDPKIRGFFYSLTLIAPILVYLIYTPTLWMMKPIIARRAFEDSSFIVSQAGPVFAEAVSGFTVAEPAFSTISVASGLAGINYPGLICVIGLVFGAVTLAISYSFGVSIVKRCQGVIDVGPEDEPRIFKTVEKLAHRVGISVPKIGLTESLQPNAFTIGYGKNAMVVFTSGLILTLNQTELEAVIAHELAHIKNRDFHLMAIASSLKVVTFFNPASYLSASLFAREREYLADDVGSKATGKRNALKRALVKIASTTTTQRRTFIPEFVSGLFIYSQIGSLKAVFTSHPSLDTRLDRIERSKSRGGDDYLKALIAALLLVGSMALLSSYIMQPMHIYEALFGFGPGFRAQMGGTMVFHDVGGSGLKMFTFEYRPIGDVFVHDLPRSTEFRQLIQR